MSGRVLCCMCGKDCGPMSEWEDEDGLPANILHEAYECVDCEQTDPQGATREDGNEASLRPEAVLEAKEWHCKCGASFVSGRGLAGHIGGKSRWITNNDHGRTGPAPFEPDPQGATPEAVV